MRPPRDPARIAPTLELVEAIWRRNPDLRLGQLIENCRGKHRDVFSIEDDELVRKLRVVYDVGENGCFHDWQEQPGEPPVDVCSSCGEVRH